MHRVFSAELVFDDALDALVDSAKIFVLEHVGVLIWRLFVHVLESVIVL